MNLEEIHPRVIDLAPVIDGPLQDSTQIIYSDGGRGWGGGGQGALSVCGVYVPWRALHLSVCDIEAFMMQIIDRDLARSRSSPEYTI